MYTEEVGWLDLKHFFKAADMAYKLGSNDIVRLGGLVVEISQAGSNSFFSYEDLPSNKAGAKFGEIPLYSLLDIFGGYNSTILDEFTDYILKQKPLAPIAAPNYKELPEVERHTNPPGEKFYGSSNY